jgi:hypothetical protein
MTKLGEGRRGVRASTSDKIWSTGLAVTACVGLVGVIGVRAMETAPTADATPNNVSAASATGLTQPQLDAYATQIAADKASLDQYRSQLVALSQQIATTQQALLTGKVRSSQSLALSAGNKTSASVPAPPPLQKPRVVQRTASKAAQTTTKSS